MAFLTEIINRYVGLSTDTKPSLNERDADSKFFETDTQNTFVWDGTAWVPFHNPAAIIFADSPSIDAFERQRISNPVSLFENKNIHSRNVHQWEEPLIGAVINHGTVTGGPFQVAEIITGGTSNTTATVTAVNAGALTITYTVNHNDFEDAETITGSVSAATAAVTNSNTASNVTHDRDNASVTLTVGQGNGDQAVRQSHRYFSYVPGKSQLIKMTFLFGAAVADVRRRIGYFETSNGIYLEQTTTGISLVHRTNTSGSVVNTLIPQSSWNYDKLDGTGRTKVNLDFTKAQFLSIDFQWQGDGRVRCGFIINGATLFAHCFNFSNTLDTVYMSTPSLPCRFEITNTAATIANNSMKEFCTAVVSEGGESPSGLGFSVSHEVTARTVTTAAGITPILAVRLKNVHPNGGENRVTLLFSDASVFHLGNNSNIHFEVVHLHDPDGITATWTDVGEDSAAEFSTDISAIAGNPGHFLKQSYHAAGQGGRGLGEARQTIEKTDQHRFASQNFDSTNSEVFIIFATAFTADVTVYATISWTEFE